jgi:hypothetical protein
MLMGCKPQTNQSEAVKQLSDLESDSVPAEVFSSPLPVSYTNENRPDTMFLVLGGDSMFITPKGKVYKNKKLFFDIRSKLEIRKIFFQPTGENLVVFYEYSDADGGGSMAKKISAGQNKIIWETPIFAFNMAVPAIRGDFAYLSTMGFVGKLNMTDGKYAWNFENIDKKYSSFNEPELLNDSVILFTRKIDPMIADSILVDDRNGKILKMD